MKDQSSNMRKNSFFDRAKVIFNEIDLAKKNFLQQNHQTKHRGPTVR